MLYYAVTAAHAYTMRRFLATRGAALRPQVRVWSYEQLLRARRLPAGAYLFSDIERLSPEQAERAAQVHGAVTAAGWPALNHPTLSRCRYDLLRALEVGGINDFGVYRATEHRWPARYPVFLRHESDHKGAISGLLADQPALEAALLEHEAAGRSRSSTLIVEFRDTADLMGVYRKYAAFCVNGAILPRHVCFGHAWMLKAGTLVDPPYLAEELAYVQTNPHRDMLAQIFRLARIDYGRIDYAMAGTRLLVWEINTNPNMDSGRNFGGPLRDAVHVYFNPRMQEALRTLAAAVAPRGAIASPPRPRGHAAWWWRSLRGRLRPSR